MNINASNVRSCSQQLSACINFESSLITWLWDSIIRTKAIKLENFWNAHNLIIERRIEESWINKVSHIVVFNKLKNASM
jgi:hypothetical protein